MSDTIPQDIREKAKAAAEGYFSDYVTRMTVEDTIALGLLAHEREIIERCAKIAEGYANTYCERISDGLAATIRETAR